MKNKEVIMNELGKNHESRIEELYSIRRQALENL